MVTVCLLNAADNFPYALKSFIFHTRNIQTPAETLKKV